MVLGMKLKSTIISASGKYYEGGYNYYHSEGCYEKREDGKFFMHYYANLGTMTQEISETEYNTGVAHLRAIDGKPTTHWSHAIMKLHEETREREVYSSEMRKTA